MISKTFLFFLLVNLMIPRDQPPTESIPIKEAGILVSGILNQPVLKKIPSTYTLGGTFPAKLFQLHPDSSAIILWFCFKGGAKPELFLALEQLKKYDSANLPIHPTSSKLSRPQIPFKDTNGTHNTPTEIERYIERHSITNNVSIPIANALAQRYISSFDSLMNTMRDSQGVKYNKYPFSIFEENSTRDLKRFVDQAGANGFVRYYFAFDDKEKPNRIRIVLVAVTAAGKNITKIGTADALILEKSVPPPPYN